MNRPSASPLLAVALLLGATGACSHHDVQTYTPVNGEVVARPLPSSRLGSTMMQPETEASASVAPEPETQDPGPAADDLSSLDDEQLAGIVHAIHRTAVDHMRLGAERASMPQVQAFAREGLLARQSEAEQDDGAFSQLNLRAIGSHVSRRLHGDCRRDLTALQGVPQAEFDRTFVDQQVDLDQRAATLINFAMSRVGNSSLRRQLERDRSAVAGHLREDQDLQKTLHGQTP